MTIDDLTLDTTQGMNIKADIESVFRSMLYRLGEGFSNPQGESLQMILEPWAGGGSAIAAMASAIYGDMYK